MVDLKRSHRKNRISLILTGEISAKFFGQRVPNILTVDFAK